MIRYCVPIIPSRDLDRSLRFWREGLGFAIDKEMRAHDGRLTLLMLWKDHLWFMVNAYDGEPPSPDHEEIRLYWTPEDLGAMRERLIALGFAPSEIVDRDYGQTEFFVTDDDGLSHCFGVRTKSNEE